MNRKELRAFADSKKAQAATVAGLALTSLSLPMAFADLNSHTEVVDKFITFVTDWLKKIGGIVALVGGVMFALGWQREDAEGKTRGLQTLMAGLMVAAIALASDMFFV